MENLFTSNRITIAATIVLFSLVVVSCKGGQKKECDENMDYRKGPIQVGEIKVLAASLAKAVSKDKSGMATVLTSEEVAKLISKIANEKAKRSQLAVAASKHKSTTNILLSWDDNSRYLAIPFTREFQKENNTKLPGALLDLTSPNIGRDLDKLISVRSGGNPFCTGCWASPTQACGGCPAGGNAVLAKQLAIKLSTKDIRIINDWPKGKPIRLWE